MKKSASLLRATLSVTVLIIIGKLLGMAREAVIAAYYGATAQTDAFFFAQGMPAMIFPAVCSSISLAFTSLYVCRITADGEIAADRYASRMLSAALLLGMALGIVGTTLSPLIVPLLAPGFEGGQLVLAIRLTRLTMGAFVLIMSQYMLAAILNSKKFFIGSQIAGLLYNIAVITITMSLGRGQSMDVLTLTVIAGHGVQIIVLIICCRGNFRYTLRQSPFHPDTKELLRFALPILLGNCVVQINNIIDKALGSTLEAGALSALAYSGSLNTLVISVFIMSLSTVLYPTLTADAASGDMKHYGENLTNSMTGLSLVLVPVSCITMLSASDIVTAVFARGSFDQSAVYLTSVALSCYAPRFVFAGVREVLARGFFAIQDTKTPMINGAIGVACNALVSIVLVRYIGIAGIAVGTSVASFVIAVLLIISANRRIPELAMKSVFVGFGKQLAAGAVLVIALLFFNRFVLLSAPLLRFAANTTLGFMVYFAALYALRSKDVLGILSALKRRLGKY